MPTFPRYAAVVFVPEPDATSRVQAIISGRVDIAGGRGPEDIHALMPLGIRA